MFSKPPGGSGQAPKRVSIGGQLLIHWLQGDLQISPPPPKRKRDSSNGNKRHVVNGNGITAFADDEVERFIVQVGVERVQRKLDKLTQPTLPLAAVVTVS